MAWTIELLEPAKQQLAKLDRQTAKPIRDFLRDRVASAPNPRSLGQALTGPKRGYWRYRVGDYRLVCSIEDDRVIILVVEIGHRSAIYR